MTGIRIREAHENDLAVHLALYRDMHDRDVAAEPAALESAWAALLAHPGAHLLLLEAEGGPVSSCVLFIHPNLTRGGRPFGLIENVVTRADARCRGYGTRLLRHALALAWQEGCYKVMLLTGRTDPSVHRLYGRAGFLAGIKTGFVAYPPGGSHSEGDPSAGR
jgi:GNAT superfamily N-acetyltransferase